MWTVHLTNTEKSLLQENVNQIQIDSLVLVLHSCNMQTAPSIQQ